MNNYFIILASGQSKRFNAKNLKQFNLYKNKPLFEHSIEKSINSNLFKKIILVVNNKLLIKKKYPKKVVIIKGGKKRHISSLIGLKYIKKFKPNYVLIHDAARPNFSIKLLKRLIKQLKKNNAVIPVTKPTDAIKYRFKNKIFNLNRENSFLTQTPQAFKFNKIYELSIKKENVHDEASMFIRNKLKIKFINGEILNKKITFKEDVLLEKTFYGIGFDIHRLIKNKKLYLGGVEIPYHSGLEGHSDGDVILHAIIDSLLGAMKKKDIGTYFPDDIKKFKNIRSPKMIMPILNMLKKNNFYINNLDINLICEKPKVSLYREKIIQSLSSLLSLEKNKINLKGKTTEKLGLIGKENAIACEAICSISQ